MRLDLFLKLSRLCLRRTLAQTLCDAGLVIVNGRGAKSSHAVKAGDELVIRNKNRRLTVRVIKLPTTRSVSKSEATTLYESIKDEDLSGELGL